MIQLLAALRTLHFLTREYLSHKRRYCNAVHNLLHKINSSDHVGNHTIETCVAIRVLLSLRQKPITVEC